jgi:hypothetical protein
MKCRVHLLASCVLLFAAVAGATTIVHMDLDELAKAASTVARVRCIGNETRVEYGTVWTITTFEVTEVLKGSAPRRITVRLVGGRHQDLYVKVEGVPRFGLDEEAYLFLEPNRLGEFTVTSWTQGTFRVRRIGTGVEQVTQDTGGLAVFDSQTRTFRGGSVRNLSVSEFKRRVNEAIDRGAGVRRGR